jgi:hypothetical protein
MVDLLFRGVNRRLVGGIVETHPHPLGPTIAVFWPAGMVKLTSLRMGRSGW